MSRLVKYECCKIWLSRRFQLLLAIFLILNVGLLWYSNIGTESTPAASYYQKMNRRLAPMSIEEKYVFLTKQQQLSEAVQCLDQITMLEQEENQEKKAYAKSLREEKQELIDTYYICWKQGDYLQYGENIMQQNTLVEEYLIELTRTKDYQNFLSDIKEKEQTLTGISIFASTQNDGFSNANIKKTASDYRNMQNIDVGFVNGKAARGMTENVATDMFLVILLLIVVSAVIFEEKEKHLFSITKITPSGHMKALIAKEVTIFVTSILLVSVFQLCNILYYQVMVGGITWGASMQSASIWMTGILHLSVLEYIILYTLAKALVIAILGSLFLGLAILTSHIIYPFVIGTIMMAGSFLLYYLVPATSSLNWFKYLNPVGLLQINKSLAEYQNLNLFGRPVQLRICSGIYYFLLLAVIFFITGMAYIYKQGLESRELLLKRFLESIHIFKFTPHGKLLLHELYKVVIMNKAVWIIALFLCVLIYQGATMSYNLSNGEIKYRAYMGKLSGELTEDKEAYLTREKKRYEEAISMLATIDERVTNGEIGEQQGEIMKGPYESAVAYYAMFTKVWKQYEYIKEHPRTQFVYDTGYLLFLGSHDKHSKIFLMELLVVMILCFSAVEAVEYRKGCYRFLVATPKGKGALRLYKYLACSLLMAFLLILVGTVRLLLIQHAFGLSNVYASMSSLPAFRWVPDGMPILGGVFLIQVGIYLVSLLLMGGIATISRLTKNTVYTMLISALVLVTPVAICL